jgi:hypothetical protein
LKYPFKTFPMKILNTLLISLLAYSASAQVGIGTSTPTVPLDIEAADAAIDINNTAGDGDPAINFQLSGITTFSLGIDDGDADKFKIGTTSIGTNTRLTIDAAGYVGIGTDEPTVPLHIKGGGVAAGDYQFFIENGNYNKGIQFQYKNGFNDFPQSKIWTSGGVWDTKLHFSTANGTNDGDTELYTALTIDDTQRIGIGTTTPTSLLTINGTATYTDPVVDFQISGATKFSMGIDDSDADKFKIGTTSIGTNTRLTIDAAGYVGIGTDEPTVPLHIKGGGVAAGDYQFFIENGNYNKGIQFQYKNGFNDFPQSKIWTSGVVWDTKLHFSTANGTNDGDTELYTALTIDDTQRIGIGTTSPTEKLHVVGNICYTGTSASCSDSRYKKDLNKIGNALEMISNFDGYTYKFKVDEFPENKFDSTQQVGFIAQELREVLPQVVLENDSGYLSVDYSKVTPLLLMAIKEQQAIIESQKQAIETIKAEASSAKIISTETAQKLASLEAKLNALLLLNSKGAVLTAEN